MLSFFLRMTSVYLLTAGVESYCRTCSHTHTHSHTVGLLWTRDRRDAEMSICTTHNTHKKTDIHTPPGFEPAMPASERPQTNALDRAATGLGAFYACKIYIIYMYIFIRQTQHLVVKQIREIFHVLPSVSSRNDGL